MGSEITVVKIKGLQKVQKMSLHKCLRKDFSSRRKYKRVIEAKASENRSEYLSKN